MSSSNRQPSQSSPKSSTIPQSLQLTDFLRPVFQDSYMIREYCLFANIQFSNGFDTQSSMTSSQETLNSGGQAKMLTGLYVIPSAQSHYLWFGMLVINSERSPSPYHGGVFRFYVRFPENYPNMLPSITFLPTSLTNGHPTTISTHPDINPTSGQFNLRPYISSTSISSSTHIPKIYKILRILRKSFYRQFNDVDVQNSVNQSAAETIARDYQEFLRNCAVEAEQSLKHLKEIDKQLVQKFKGDANLILLGGWEERREVVSGVGKERGGKVIGLSFMGV